MRALILSDMHANIDALDAVLEAAPEHDVVWNLGDVVGYNAAPQAVIEKAREIGSPRRVFVRGNHDRACAGLIDAENFNPVAFRAVQWTQGQLDPESIQWLKEMPRGPIYCRPGASSPGPPDSVTRNESQTSGPEVACVHGSLVDEDEYLLSTWDAEGQLAYARTQITFFGHTHVQGGFAANAAGEWFRLQPVYTDDNRAESYDLDLRSAATYLINPGAVGQPRDRDWRAAFALYDDEAARVTFFRVPYDVRLAQMRIRRARLPEMLASRLGVGR
ncbi:MAG: metallophosphoesterase family protein [Acidobacteriaceae bacterium]